MHLDSLGRIQVRHVEVIRHLDGFLGRDCVVAPRLFHPLTEVITLKRRLNIGICILYDICIYIGPRSRSAPLSLSDMCI